MKLEGNFYFASPILHKLCIVLVSNDELTCRASHLRDPEVDDLLPQHLHTLLPHHVVLARQHVSCPPSQEPKLILNRNCLKLILGNLSAHNLPSAFSGDQDQSGLGFTGKQISVSFVFITDVSHYLSLRCIFIN